MVWLTFNLTHDLNLVYCIVKKINLKFLKQGKRRVIYWLAVGFVYSIKKIFCLFYIYFCWYLWKSNKICRQVVISKWDWDLFQWFPEISSISGIPFANVHKKKVVKAGICKRRGPFFKSWLYFFYLVSWTDKELSNSLSKVPYWLQKVADIQWRFIYLQIQTNDKELTNSLLLASDWLSKISECDLVWQKMI